MQQIVAGQTFPLSNILFQISFSFC